jgi:glycosyltransferase involved in cell wall biosynthesis
MQKKIIIICGPRDSYGFCPVPPINNSAPEKNIFRLIENDFLTNLKITVLSACGKSQKKIIRKDNLKGDYINLEYPNSFLKFNKSIILNNRVVRVFFSKILSCPDFFSFIYLYQISKIIQRISPDLILINSLPQYTRYLRKRFPDKKIGLFQRGELGSSRKNLDLLDLIFTNSVGISDYLRKFVNNKKVKIKEIPNSLEISFSPYGKKNYSKNIKYLIFTGRLIEDKGVFQLLQAFKLVQESFPYVQLRVVGGAEKLEKNSSYEKKLMGFSKENNLNVEFIGQIPNENLASFYNESDLAIFPSICLESFGMVALEAMRCGLPVIASRRPGFEQLITHNVDGILVDNPEDIGLLAESIIGLIKNPNVANTLGKNAYLRSFEFTPAIAAHEFEIIVKELFQ